MYTIVYYPSKLKQIKQHDILCLPTMATFPDCLFCARHCSKQFGLMHFFLRTSLCYRYYYPQMGKLRHGI